ncbi:hypothetical protein B0H19DRAFT_1233140 [Mycena capillaripes]|nr:hypothetical protein B0H19DRAFT_1233140 [Mycena capillaripes]
MITRQIYPLHSTPALVLQPLASRLPSILRCISRSSLAAGSYHHLAALLARRFPNVDLRPSYLRPGQSGAVHIQLAILASCPAPTTTRFFVGVTHVVVSLHVITRGPHPWSHPLPTSHPPAPWAAPVPTQPPILHTASARDSRGSERRALENTEDTRGVVILVCERQILPPILQPSGQALFVEDTDTAGVEGCGTASARRGIARIWTRKGERQHDSDAPTLFTCDSPIIRVHGHAYPIS